MLSPKQIKSFNEATKRLNFWVGAVRSGKTYSSLLKLIDFMKNGPQGAIMIVGVNRDSIQRNVLSELYKFLGCSPPSSKTNETRIYGRNVYFVGAHDEGAVRRIQGSTLACAYVDEATCIPQPFFKMLLSRLSITGAQLFATMNPEAPSHWLKKQFVDKADELDLSYFHFVMDDNPSLSEEYKNSLKREYGNGAWYRRLILGEWALASGLIYPDFDDDNIYENTPLNTDFYIMGIDYGTTNATAAVIAACSPKLWPQIRIESEYYYDSREHGRPKTDDELVQDIKNFISWRPMKAIYVDPAAASFKIALQNEDLPVIDANNDVLLGIKIVEKFIANKNVVVHKSCKHLIEGLQSYVWDTKAADRGEDKPLKHADHIQDGFRYCLASAFPRGIFNSPHESISISQLRREVYGEPEGLNWGLL